VHVRRGDYLQHPGTHPVVSKEYILKAMDHIVDNTDCNFAIFSDDMDYCREMFDHKYHYRERHLNFVTPGNGIKKYLTDKNYAWHDFQLMANCGHNIISNSSFSLMAAHFNHHKDKIVIAPQTWTGLGPDRWDTSSFIPDGWLKM
jgi:hypothetical protein